MMDGLKNSSQPEGVSALGTKISKKLVSLSVIYLFLNIVAHLSMEDSHDCSEVPFFNPRGYYPKFSILKSYIFVNYNLF